MFFPPVSSGNLSLPCTNRFSFECFRLSHLQRVQFCVFHANTPTCRILLCPSRSHLSPGLSVPRRVDPQHVIQHRHPELCFRHVIRQLLIDGLHSLFTELQFDHDVLLPTCLASRRDDCLPDKNHSRNCFGSGFRRGAVARCCTEDSRSWRFRRPCETPVDNPLV